MNAEQLALLRSYVDRYQELRTRVRFGPARVRVGKTWRKVVEVRRLGYVLELLCTGHGRVRLPDDAERAARIEAEADRLIALARRLSGDTRARKSGTGHWSLIGGSILRFRLGRGRQRIAVVAAVSSAPRSKAARLLVALILWWRRTPEGNHSLVLIPATWGDYFVELLQHLSIPLGCYAYSRSGKVRRIYPRDDRQGEAQSPYVIYPVESCPSRVLEEKANGVPELDLLFRAGRWELSFRGMPVLWSKGTEELFYDLRHPRLFRDEEAWQVHLDEVRRFRRWPPPDPCSFFYRWSSERWLEWLVLRNHRKLLSGLEEIYCQVPTFVEGDRKVLDLMALREDGRVVVIELKPSKDPGLLIQGLDYWQRVRFHLARGDLQQGGYFRDKHLSSEDPLLALVSPLFEFHRVMPVLRTHLKQSIQFECLGINSDWRREIRVLRRVRF